MTRGGRWRVTLALFCLLPTLGVLATAEPAAATGWNPVYRADFPDPAIYQFNNVYLAYSTQSGLTNSPTVISSDTVHWTADGPLTFPVLPVWASYGYTWAPTVARNASGQYVMFYTARQTSSGLQCIGRAIAAAPTGPFYDTGFGPAVCQKPEGGSIDPDIFTDDNGNAYLLWKGDGHAHGDVPALWSQPLGPSLSLEGTPTPLLVAGDQRWQHGVIEGPAMAEINHAFYLFYSGNNYDTSSYAIGFALCAGPSGPCADSRDNPVLRSSPGMQGPGGPTFFSSPTGALLMGFAAWSSTVGYENGGYRALYIASVHLTGGMPYFESYP